jgi:hypothetical protein
VSDRDRHEAATCGSLNCTRRWPRSSAWSTVVLVLVAAAGSVLCQQALADRGHEEADRPPLYYPSGRFLREATPGLHELAADYLWFQAVQYYGAYRMGQHDLRYFRGLVDGVLALDPGFVDAYRFAALVLAMDMHDPSAGRDLLTRGILANPESWILPFEVGFVHYVMERDYARAATWFDAAAATPGADDIVRRFAAWSHDRAGEPEVALALWRAMYANAPNPDVREVAKGMIEHYEAMLEPARSGPGGEP